MLLFPGPDYQGPVGLRRLTVGGAMRGSRVNALADIGAVSAGAMFDSDVVAGVRFEEVHPAAGVFEPVLPSEHYEGYSESDKEFDFTGRYALGSLGVTAAVTDAGGFAFVNSRVAAHRIGGVKLVGVQPQNNGRDSGVAGYRVSRVQRRFGGPDGPALSREEYPRTNYFIVRQLFQPLRFDPGTGTYTSGSGFINLTNGLSGGTTISSGTLISAAGVQVGTMADHPTAATVWLNLDGSYDARGADGVVVVRDATLAGLCAAARGHPGHLDEDREPRHTPVRLGGGAVLPQHERQPAAEHHGLSLSPLPRGRRRGGPPAHRRRSRRPDRSRRGDCTTVDEGRSESARRAAPGRQAVRRRARRADGLAVAGGSPRK